MRIHFERAGTGFRGTLINPSGNETVLDQTTSDGTRLHVAVNKLDLRYHGVWNDEEKVWKGNLTFQQVYPSSGAEADALPAVCGVAAVSYKQHFRRKKKTMPLRVLAGCPVGWLAISLSGVSPKSCVGRKGTGIE